MVVEIEERLIQDPLLLEKCVPYTPPLPPKPENAGHAAIRRLNWERRVGRLKKDWYRKSD
tara:strand:+ start:175238 stop:175417 length:180 start_codon:yes stop_codon:yes gene_type:complete